MRTLHIRVTFSSILLLLGSIGAASFPPNVHYSPSTSFYTPEAPRTTEFDPSLQTGSEDIPLASLPFAPGDTSFPEQVHLQYVSPTTVVASWVTGDAIHVKGPVPIRTDSPPPSVVVFGPCAENLNQMATGEAVTYSQAYAVEPAYNYTSGYVHHVKLSGLAPATTYFYKAGDSGWRTSRVMNFTTLQEVTPVFKPYRITMFADLGGTWNSSVTLQHAIQSKPDLVISIGDYTYADNYCSNGIVKGCLQQTYQPRWDGCFRFMEALLSTVPWLNIAGNHEIESQAGGTQFAAYLARNRYPGTDVTATAVPSNSTLYYSADITGAHLVFLNPYTSYNTSSAQYQWLLADLNHFNRIRTPWLFVFFHAPIYNSYAIHYKEIECFRETYEELLYAYGADVVFHGHVHAYERTNRVYNYVLDACAPAYVTIGDGGNIERLYKNFADSPGQCPPTPTPNCPSYQNGSYCYSTQPAWSAFREPSFGHATLDIVDKDTAKFSWHRNQDSEAVVSDTVIYRRPEGRQCANHAYPKGESCEAFANRQYQCFDQTEAFFVCCEEPCPTEAGLVPLCRHSEHL